MAFLAVTNSLSSADGKFVIVDKLTTAKISPWQLVLDRAYHKILCVEVIFAQLLSDGNKRIFQQLIKVFFISLLPCCVEGVS